ncbi:MAG: hypothetical protein J6W86_08960 [Bacteroidales bacterium]|nr:hypothetical protein [Bacteroidales bacterium]
MKSGNEILEELLNDLSIKLPTFAKQIGIPYRSMFDIQKGKVKSISPSVANAIHMKYPQYPLFYLLTGEGNKVVDVSGSHNVIGNNNGNQTEVINKLVDELAASRKNNERLLNIIEDQMKVISNLR